MSSKRRLLSACGATLAAAGLLAFAPSAQADLLIDLRLPDGSKAGTIGSGQTLTLDVFAKVNTPLALTTAGFQEVHGSYLSALGTGSLLGTINPAGDSSDFPPRTVVGIAPFNAGGASTGDLIDLDGDTDLDRGHANADNVAGFVVIRSDFKSMEQSQPPPPPPWTGTNTGQLVDGGAAVEWKIGRISFTADSGANGDTTNINFRYRRTAAGQMSEFAALWFESTGSKDGFNAAANMFVGTPVTLTLGGTPQWNVDLSGSWSVAGNWSGGVPNASNAVANFLGKITAPRSVSLDGSKQVKEIHFDNANKYTITPGSGGTLTVGDGTSGTIEVVQATHEISAPITLSGNVSKTGPGTLIISGTQTNSAGAGLSVAAGQVNLNSNAGTSATAGTAATATAALNISGDGAKVVAGANQDLSSLSVAHANAGLQGLDLASPAAAGQFRAIRVYGGDLDAAKASLSASMRNAATNPGDGIFDSGLAAHANSGLGIAKITDVHGDMHVQIRPTRMGDTNLDGIVTISDFLDLASNFNATNRTWQEGDLNNDGTVTISDFLDLASNFNASYSGETFPISPEDGQLLASFAASNSAASAVPEPATVSLLALGGLGLLRRRSRRYITRSGAAI